MIINIDRTPTLSLYYLGGIVLDILNDSKGETTDKLFEKLKAKINTHIHIDFFYYTLDWLFLLSLIILKNGVISKC